MRLWSRHVDLYFFFNDTATTEIYTLSLHDALPICRAHVGLVPRQVDAARGPDHAVVDDLDARRLLRLVDGDRKSTRLNSSHANISYAVFCLKKKKEKQTNTTKTTMRYKRHTITASD